MMIPGVHTDAVYVHSVCVKAIVSSAVDSSLLDISSREGTEHKPFLYYERYGT